MKLDCGLVEDLYPLYEENELREENKQAVDEHLKHCKNCSELYQQEKGFSDLTLSDGSGEISKEVDDRIRLRFRLRRMKGIAALLAAVIIVSGINNYAANREKVAELLDGVYLYSESLKEIAKNPYEIDMNRDILSYAAEDISDLDNELNWLERNQFNNTSIHLLVNSQEFDEMAAILKERKNQGLEDETDLKVTQILRKHTNTLFNQAQKEYRAFHHGYSSYFEILDIEGIGKPIGRIDELSFFYNRYHKLPSEMKLIKEKELKKKIITAFNAKAGRVALEKTHPSNKNNGVYRFDLKNGSTKIDGEIDGYSGLLISANVYSHKLNERKPKNMEDVKKNAEKMLKLIYGKSARFEIKLEQNNEKEEGQPNLYRFRYTPLTGQYKLLFPLGDPFYIEFDAGTGEFYQFSGEPAIQSREFFSKKFNHIPNKAAPENKASQILGGRVKKMGKGIIYSTVSTDYVLVHIYEGKGNRVYINAETGIVERPYLSIH
ncbi:hypothetical protein JOC77_003764 [Peribacillus deserti]|uniref:Putative zinc-finger domain-containing protein n=1 Tax=Peribacillus deserti TaxID=673318 RepID=A0ABS2QMB5_9BACI|nr:zf-HC2 domain-containing protein [Peribacillus deserti]MBM7694303.1 hypothetical protein [Peribacillus deserti]